MKQIVFNLILFSFFSLLADMSTPEQFLPETGFKINDKYGLDIYEGVSYFTFLDNSNTIKLGMTTDWQDFEFITTSYSVVSGFEEPIIKVKNENEIYIAYSSFAHDVPQPQTFLLKTNNGGDSFTRTIVGNSGAVSPLLNIIDDEIEITCYEGWQEPLSRYERFSNFEASENVNVDDGGNGILPYSGTDVVFGPVHSNDDIWIRQMGGGSNSGWPTFHGFVSTTGKILLPSGVSAEDSGAPMDIIFRGGYQEEVVPKNGINASAIRANGTWLFNEGDFQVCYVNIEGGSATIYKGMITSQVEEFPVYSWYPADADWVDFAIENDFNWFEDSEVIATNYVTVYDTTWVVSSMGIPDYSTFFVPAELWIKGEVTGNQTWGSSGNVRIIGDITYTGTNVGDHPDGFSGLDDETNEPEYDGSVNTHDYFGLVSEQNIYIAYKNYTPDPSHQLETPNVEGGTDNHVYLYGSYAAIAQGDVELYGDDAPYYDGQFTFEYQHPHGSTPNFIAASPFTGEDTLYKYIDLHKFILPTEGDLDENLEGFLVHSSNNYNPQLETSGYPNINEEYLNSFPNLGPNYVYPHGTDYPWYNPVWPEAAQDIVMERGTLHVFGSIAQTRKGFTHRSGSDPANHPGENWDLDAHQFGGSHASTGYDRDYFNDRRLETVNPNNFPYIINGSENKIVTYSSIDDGETFSVVGEFDLSERSNFAKEELIGNYDWKVLVSSGYDTNIYITNNNWETVNILPHSNMILDMQINEDFLYSYDYDSLSKYDLNLEQWVDSWEYPYDDLSIASLLLMGANPVMITNQGDELYFAYSTNGELELSNSYILPHDGNWSYVKAIKSYKTDDEELLVFFDFYDGNTLLTHGTIDGLTDVSEENIPASDFSLTNFPNPFNPSTEISFTAKKAENAKIEIYNIKGQHIREFKMDNVKCKMNKIIWNGSDQSGHPVASGIYYYTLKLDGKLEAARKMVLLK